jgi:hypothetical protein
LNGVDRDCEPNAGGGARVCEDCGVDANQLPDRAEQRAATVSRVNSRIL